MKRWGMDELLQELKREPFDKYDAFTVGEVFRVKEERPEESVGDEGRFSTMFDFAAHEMTLGEKGWYDNRPLLLAD